MDKRPALVVLATIALFTAGPLVSPGKVFAEMPTEAEPDILISNRDFRFAAGHGEFRQKAVADLAEKLLIESFRTELSVRLERKVLRAEQDQARARQNLNAAKALENEYEEALAAAKLSTPHNDSAQLEKKVASAKLNVERSAQATFDALAQVNGFGATLEDLTKFDLLLTRVKETEPAPSTRLRSGLPESDFPVSSLAIELADRLYALGVVDLVELSRGSLPSSRNNADTAAGSPKNEQPLDWIFGATVQSPAGENLGSISDVIVDRSTGKIDAAIVGIGGFLGIGVKKIALPWEQLEIDYDLLEITSDLTREEADAAPEYVFRDDEDIIPVGPDDTTADTAPPVAAEQGENADAFSDANGDEVVFGDPGGEPSDIDPTALMPELFPWPPPEASSRATISRRLFGTDPPQDLGEVAVVLQEALAEAGYTGLGYLGVPGGFAMITRIEQHDNSGRPLSGNNRWATQIVVVKSFSISGIIRALMTTEPGFFRVLVLVVTDKPFSDSRPRDRLEVLERWSRQGLDALVPAVKDMPFSENYKVTALVYEFEKGSEGEDPLVRVPGRNEAPGHLAHTRFSNFLQ